MRIFHFNASFRLISRCDDLTPFLPYIMSILIERLNSHDLDGILDLPEVMRPPPSQKPQVLHKLVETSEEVSHTNIKN